MRRLILLILVFLVPLAGEESVDLAIVQQIKTEAFDHSKVMDHLFYLTDVYGPRLNASPEYRQAADWAVKRLQEIGLSNVHLERFGPWGRAWTIEQYAVEMVEPRYSLLASTPLAWSGGTPGPVTGSLVLAPFRSRELDPKKAAQDLDKYRKDWTGKLRGKIVLMTAPKPFEAKTRPQFHRYSDNELADLVKAPAPEVKIDTPLNELKYPDDPNDPEERRKFLQSLPSPVREALFDELDKLKVDRAKFFRDEGVVGVLIEDGRAEQGLSFGEDAAGWEAKNPLPPPMFVVTREHYNRLTRLLDHNVPATVRLNLKVSSSQNDSDSWNIVGEIPGSGAHKDEIVMVGAHFDSWHSGTGATDNGAGSAVMIEVMRVLKTLNLKLDRTVRIGLWGGEEQGFFGSRAYVKEHFGDPKTMHLTEAHAKLSGYFNFDNGSGKIRGVYLQGNDAMRPIFEHWLAPFRDMGVNTISIRNTGGTDHLTFDDVGLPGFQFIQEPLDYSTVTHHSSMDTYDHVVEADLMQASAVIASVVSDAANRPERLPRKALPKPWPKPQATSGE